jgi:RimJ/RimL family protein N-acetyltransferase
MRSIPILETERLLIRPYELGDLVAAQRLAARCFGDGSAAGDPAAIEAFTSMMQWMTLNTTCLAALDQPPYGDRAVLLKHSGELIGQVGYTPCVDHYVNIPALALGGSGSAQAEVGLFWAIDPDHRSQGYASEAARALIDYAFDPNGAWLGLRRIIATTEFDNHASQAVMRKLGMRLERNNSGQPVWLQVVGVLER